MGLVVLQFQVPKNETISSWQNNIVSLCEYILGFTPALLNIGSGQQQLSKNSRDGHRAILDSPELTGYLFEVIKPHLPSTITSNGSKINPAANVYGGCEKHNPRADIISL